MDVDKFFSAIGTFSTAASVTLDRSRRHITVSNATGDVLYILFNDPNGHATVGATDFHTLVPAGGVWSYERSSKNDAFFHTLSMKSAGAGYAAVLAW